MKTQHQIHFDLLVDSFVDMLFENAQLSGLSLDATIGKFMFKMSKKQTKKQKKWGEQNFVIFSFS